MIIILLTVQGCFLKCQKPPKLETLYAEKKEFKPIKADYYIVDINKTKYITLKLEKFKAITSNYKACKQVKKECEAINGFLNFEIEKYNKHFSK